MTPTRKAPGTAGAPSPVIDREDALERLEGDASLLEELLGLFREEYPGKKQEIDQAIAAGDGEALRLAAHALKGASANLSLTAIRESAFRLELAGKEGRLAEAAGLADGLRAELERFEAYRRDERKPPAPIAAPGRTVTPGPRSESPKLRVLIVDDARDTRRLIKTWTDEAGCAADTAADGIKALGRVEAAPYDVIFLDLNLGRRSGIEVLAGIRDIEKRTGRRPARVIAFSATPPSEVGSKCREAGFDDCLEKPVTRTAFLAALEPRRAGGRDDRAGTAIDVSIDDLVPAYLENRRSDIKSMTASLALGEWEAIAELGHKIKGSGASYGFPEISDLGREIERAAGARDRDAVRAALMQLAARVKEASRG